MANHRETEDILDAQNDEEVVEIDPDGNVTPKGRAREKRGGKPTILTDPRGEYRK